MSRPASPGLGSSPRGSVVNLQQYAADAKISSHRGEELTAGLMSGEQKAAAAPVNGCESILFIISLLCWTRYEDKTTDEGRRTYLRLENAKHSLI
jgi:hypothetical protein